MAGIGDLAHHRDHPQFLEQHRVERDLVETVEDVAGAARRAGPLDGIDGDEDGVLGIQLADERGDGRVAGIAAVPIGLAVDLDRLEHGGQAGRGEEYVRREILLPEDAAAPGVDVGGGDEQLDRRLADAVEIDELLQNLAERVLAAGIEIVGRVEPGHHVQGDEERRVVERPAAEEDIERTALERAEPRRVGDPLPEILKRLPGTFGAAVEEAGCKDRRVHRTGGRARDAVDDDAGLLEQAVEHAPGEGAMRPAALKREVHRDRFG